MTTAAARPLAAGPRVARLRAALERLASPVSADLFRWFRVCFGLKLFLVAVIRHGTTDVGALLLLAVLAAALVNLGARRRYLPGAAVFAVYSLWVIVSRWPFPINHQFFEALVMWVVLLLPAPEGEPGAGLADGWSVHVLQYAVLSLFVFSGLQKIVHGHHLGGSLFTLHALYVPDYLGDRLRDLLAVVARARGEELAPHLGWSGGYAAVPISAPAWVVPTLAALAAVVVALEMGLPFLVAWRRTRTWGLALLIALQLGIAAASNEVGIAFVTLNCMLLFLRRRHRVGYGLLMAAQVAYYVTVMAVPGAL